MTEKLTSFYKKTDQFSIWDWILLIVLGTFCFLSFAHIDLFHTGNRSWIVYEGIGKFYDNVAAWTQGNGANYMPSTFWLFALWNLPLKLLGVQPPEYVGELRLVLCYWYKILPLLFYMASGYLFYRIALEIGFQKHKAKVAMYAFLTFPIGFFSQFIFSQCDIFTIFFMLCGIYYYYRNQKKDMLRFAFFFGIAITFKYFAAVIFLVFLLIREKKVINVIKYGLCFILPFAAEFLLYFRQDGFKRSVLGFGALEYASGSDFATSLGSVSYMKVGCVFLVLWAYFVHAKNKKDEIAWTLYLSCGVCFAIFGFMTWHPQWLIFMAPFMVLSAYINEHLEKFLWIDLGMIVCFYFLCFVKFSDAIDSMLLLQLIWRNVLHTDAIIYKIVSVFPTMDLNTSYSILVAALLAVFLFKHPKYTLKDYGQKDETDYMYILRLRLVAAVVMFAFPAFVVACMNAFR